MADLGVLRTFVKSFNEALDILDEAERIKATTEERRAELATLTAAWQAQRVSLDAAKAATTEAQSRQSVAEGEFRAYQASIAAQQSKLQQEFERALAETQNQFQAQRATYRQEIDRLDQVLKGKQAELEAAQNKIEQTKSALRELVASVK